MSLGDSELKDYAVSILPADALAMLDHQQNIKFLELHIIFIDSKL